MLKSLSSPAGKMLIVIALLFYSSIAYAITNSADVKDIGVDEKLGSYIPADLSFYDADNRPVKIKDFFQDGKPVVLSLNYYECPLLCTYVLNGVLDAVNELDSLLLGKDYRIVTVSFDPAEAPELARKKAASYYRALRGGQSDWKDWHFLTGNQENITALTQAVGFKYKKDGEQFAHASSVIILTPQAKISRYLYGVEYGKDFKLALLEASDGKIGQSELINRVLLFCYHFDPVGKKYALQALNIVKAGGVVTFLSVAGLLTYYWRKEKEKV